MASTIGNFYQLPLLGIIGYLVALHLGVWVAWPRRRFPFWMGAWFLLSGVFVATRMVQFQTGSGTLVLHLVHLQYAVALLLVLVGLPIVEQLGGVPIGRGGRRVILVGALLLIGGQWVIGGDRLDEFTTPLGQRFLGTHPGPFTLLIGGVAFAALLVVVLRIRGATALSRGERRLLMGTLLASAALALHDLLIFAAGLPSLPLLGLGFLLQGLIFSGVLVMRSVRLHGSLELLVEERTAELEARNRQLGDALQVAEAARAESNARAAALARSEASARALFERSTDGMLALRDGRLLYVNARWRALLGHPDDAPLVGRRLDEVVHPDDRGLFASALAGASGGGYRPAELLLHRLDGTLLECELSLAAAELEGSPATLLELRDQTDQRELQRRLEMSDRLAALGVLAAGVAHEINNPLAFVLTNASVLLERLRQVEAERPLQPAELIEAATDIEIGAERVRRIVADLQLFSRTPRGRSEPADVGRVLETSLRLAHAELRGRARVVSELTPVPPVLADEAQLGQVFLNLLINAAHACPEGDAGHHQIAVRAFGGPGGEVVVEVADDGVGIPPEIVPRIFDPFFTTKRTGKGTGLGLSICHSIVSSIGGRIEVRSRVDQGTTMTVRLPPAPGVPAPAPRRARLAAATPPAAQARILVVDDEPQVAKVIVRALEGHAVTTVGSGDEALRRLEGPEAYDVIFCDLMMPGMTGMDLFDRIAVRRPDYLRRFVFVTGGAFTDQARQFLDTCGAPALLKPFQLSGIRAVVDQVRERAAGVGQAGAPAGPPRGEGPPGP